MGQPTPFNRLNNFTDPVAAVDLNAEVDAVELTLDGLCTNIALIQRDDGALANVSVHPESLTPTVLGLMSAGLVARGDWLTGTAYAVHNAVIESGQFYVCLVLHVAGTFNTDLAAGKWMLFSWHNLFSQSGTYPAGTVGKKLQQIVSVTDAPYNADPTGVADSTAGIQAALDAAWAARRDVFIPGGTYLVTSLTLPGTYPTPDERDRSIRIYGQGYGNPYSQGNTGGTVLRSVTNAPILTDRTITAPNAHGTYEIDHIRFDGTSSTPVVNFYGFYGTSSLHDCVIYQRSSGDGLKILYCATGWVYNTYAQNSDFATAVLGAARTGIAFNLINAAEGGLASFYKCSARGWLTGYSVGGGAGTSYSTKYVDCEVSTTYNGFVINVGATSTSIADCFFEGGDGGIAVLDNGQYTTVQNSNIFSGFLTLIDASSVANFNGYYHGNKLSLGAVVNATAIKISARGKRAIANSIFRTTGTAGQAGINIIDGGVGSQNWLTLVGNTFDPREAWTGAGSAKILDQTTKAIDGLIQVEDGAYDLPQLAGGSLLLKPAYAVLTQANVAANVLTITAGSWFTCSATAGVTVNAIAGPAAIDQGHVVVFITTTANMTFANTAQIKLAGAASFSGPGQITFIITKIGGLNYAYEIARTVF